MVELCQKPPPIFSRPRARVHLENWRRTAGVSHGNAIFKDDLRLPARHWDGWDGFSGWWLIYHSLYLLVGGFNPSEKYESHLG